MTLIKGQDVNYLGNETLPLCSSCEDYDFSRFDPPDSRSVFPGSISTGDTRIDCPTRQCRSDLRIQTHDTVDEYDRIEITDESLSDSGINWCSVSRKSTDDTEMAQSPLMQPVVTIGVSQQDEDSDILTSECDGNDSDICNLLDVQSETEQGVDAWDAGFQHEIIDGVTVYYGGYLDESEDSEWEDPEETRRREIVENANFDLLEGMEPMVFVPTPRGDRGRFKGIDPCEEEDPVISEADVILNKRREPWRKYCASLFSKGLAPFPSNPEVLPPNNVVVIDLPCKAHTQVGGSTLDIQREFDIVSVVNVVRNDNDNSKNSEMLATGTALSLNVGYDKGTTSNQQPAIDNGSELVHVDSSDLYDQQLGLPDSNMGSVDAPDWLTESAVAPEWKGLDYITEPEGQQDHIAHTPVASTRTPCVVFQDQHERLDSSHPRDLAVTDRSLTKMDGGGQIDTDVDFGCDFALRIPWDAQEELADINSNNAVLLGSLPDVVGLCNRQPGAVPSRIVQGRDSRSIRFLVPDPRCAIQNFHDVTVVDMDKIPEPKISTKELSLLRDQWPQAIFRYMTLRQQDLEILRNVTKLEFRQTRASECSYCGKVAREFMYRHVADFHLGLAQLWRCPISWCTVWAGSQSECMDHIRIGHSVIWRPATSRVEEFIPPWTVSREFWTESLKAEHSGISTDIVLFGKIGLSLVHHYRIHRDGLPHIAFRRDYVTSYEHC